MSYSRTILMARHAIVNTFLLDFKRLPYVRLLFTVTRNDAQREKKDRVVRRREGIPVKKPELTERSRIIRPFFGNV